MKIRDFEEIIAWQKSKTLTLEVYEDASGIRDFGYRDQLQRASVSIMNNIAEGFERNIDKEFCQFLYYAKASCAEVKSMLVLGVELDYFSDERYALLRAQAIEVSKVITGLIKSLQ